MSKIIRIKISIFLFLIALITVQCRRDDFSEIKPPAPPPLFETDGIWCINEGLLGQGNGEISFINRHRNTISHNVFYSVNGIRPGDILCDMLIDDSLIILTVNNSHRIWIMRKNDAKIIQVIENVRYPRHIAKIGNKRYVISAFAHDSMYVLNYHNGQFAVNRVYTENPTENIIVMNNKVFVSHWSAFGGSYTNRSISIFEIQSLAKIASIQVGKEPNSMVIDRDGFLWILCSGGFDNSEYPTLWKINPQSSQVIKTYTFNQLNSSPFSLSIDPSGEWLYYINTDIYKMHIHQSNLSEQPFIYAQQRNFYQIDASIDENFIFVADAKNFTLPGEILVYDNSGQVQQTFQAGIIPCRFRRHQ